MLQLTFFVLLVFQMMDPFKASETFKKLVGINGSKLKNETDVKTELTRLTNVNIHYEKTTITSFWKNLNNPIDKSILFSSIICVLILLALVTAVIVCILTEIKKQSHRKRGKKNQKKEQPKLKKKPTITISSSTGKKQISSTESIETSAQ